MDRLRELLIGATEGSRTLDAEVWLLLGWGEDDQYYGPQPVPPHGMVNGMTMTEAFDRYPEDIDGIARAWNVPPVTRSMDIAYELLREVMRGDEALGIRRRVGVQENNSLTPEWTAYIEWSDDGVNLEISPTAPTPALAMCLAAIAIKESSET